MIHSVNLNATEDHVFVLPALEPGAVLRSAADLSYPGGKGGNAARAAALLGGRARVHAFCPAAGAARMRRFFKERGAEVRLTPASGEARPCVILLDGARNQETVVNSASRLRLGAAALARLRAGLLRDLRPGDIVTFSGSIPAGLRGDTYRRLIAAVAAKGGVALLDSSGEGLVRGVEGAPFLVKPNAEELGQAFQVPVLNRGQVVRAARALLRHGVRCVVVTLGAHGAVCVTNREVLYAAPLPTPRGLRSSVGCGDSFLGALALGFDRGRSLEDCLRLATAAAWANLMVPGAVFFDPRLVQAQAPRVQVSRLAA